MSKADSSRLPEKYKAKLERIYIENKKMMYYIAMKYVNNTDNAEDIVQASFIRIIRHIDKIESFSAEERKGYIIFIVKNLAIDFIRQSENSKSVPLENFEDYLESNDSLPEKAAEINYEISKVIKELENLDPKYSFAVIHKYILGYSMEEIAQSLNITVANAKVRCHRGRKLLLSAILEGEINE